MKCDGDTFAKMYQSVYQDLYRFALCILRDGQEAEDAVSEAVLAGYENIGKLRKEEAFKSWMFTILANQCKKRFRERARLVSLNQEETFFSVEARETDPGLALDVRKAFSILSEEEQMIVGLSVFGGYTSREISRGFDLEKAPKRGTERSTVKRRAFSTPIREKFNTKRCLLPTMPGIWKR